MEIRKKKTISIYRLFLEHLIGLSIATIVFILALIVIISVSFQSGFILPANYTDIKINQLEETFVESFDKSALPPYCSYVVINVNGDVSESNMTERELKKTKSYLLSGNKSYYDFYKEISQYNGNIIIIKYDILAHFRNPLLHKMIPYPELLMLFFLLVCIILFAVIAAAKFSKRLKQNLNSIIIATEKIGNQDLDFDIIPTQILEFNTVLNTIEDLKVALAASLKEQWDKEQQKKSQLSALAHDIKTPLTVIKGNAELLAESDSSKEDKEMISFIQSSSDTIEKYLELLMNVVNNRSIHIDKNIISLTDFLHDVSTESVALCKTKRLAFMLNNTVKCDTIYADGALLKRAIINIIDNAVRYSQTNSEIDLTVSENGAYIMFYIADKGRGFSEESLKKATQEFFTEDTSRTNQHYGLGLSFAKAVAEIHQGTLELKNHIDTEGATVGIKISKVHF
ncbi:HAMP domain-containing sensor histidine kinase [Anaerotignum propionicum]|uniref:HAMP domain-containing sensor histidine kinase n=1 Tax=Anaerotignum propionicum TaxID=28446 RepID=UPI00210EC564|nr:HAMP domain-containing sensor histidine kinase [Anaerotignum propionicum]MCQ4936687.1 HAMP domain-containing histidine kinase [Anaerotignum propionicum]